MPHITAIHHIALKYKNLKQAIHFYEDIFGLVRYKTHYDQINEVRSCWYKMGHCILMLERYENNEQTLTNTIAPWPLLAFTIAKCDKEMWRNKLVQHNITITAETNYTIYFKDPTGYAVALSHYDADQ